MSLSDLLHLLARKWLLLLLVPLALGGSTYYFARNLTRTYGSDTTIYTGIASGYSLTGNAGTDYNATNNAFDNLTNLITARSTKEEVVYRLLANHLWQVSQRAALLGTAPFRSLRESLPADLRRQLTGFTEAATLLNVRHFARADNANAIYQLLNSGNPPYSLAGLDHLTATRIGSSDLIRLEFESDQPETCRFTLALVTQVFLEESKNLREGQTTSVIQYYEGELRRAKDRLTRAESANLHFNRDNNIINYEAQSRNVAAEKEALAVELTQGYQQYAGAQAALQAVNRKLGGRQEALLTNHEVLEQRQKLSLLNARIADQQLFSQQEEPGTAVKVQLLQAEADKTVQALRLNVDNYYAHSNSPEGIPNSNLLTEWVQAMVLEESTRAKLAVMDRRRQQFEREYQRMAPLGATLKSVEREIELAEKAYLTDLASLNASKATQQNTQLTANLNIIDPPNLPLHPKTNKLLLLVLLSVAGGFVFTAGLVLGLGLLDNSLANPTVAARRTGLPVAGIMIDAQGVLSPPLQVSQQHSLDQLIRHILLRANTLPAPSPFVVGVFSVQRQEGKTTLCQALAGRCHAMGVRTLSLYPDCAEPAPVLPAPSLFYPAEIAAVQGWPLAELIAHATPAGGAAGSPPAQVVLVEFPALREAALPVGVLRQLDLVFLTVPATRTWRPTDRQSVADLRAAISAPVEVVLSGVAAHHLARAGR